MRPMVLVAVMVFAATRAVAQPCMPGWSDEFALQTPPGTNGPVYALAVYNSELVAGGCFTTTGGVSANNVARWNGTHWGELGTGINGNVYVLQEHNGELIAGRNHYTDIESVNGLVRWSGAEWVPFNTGSRRWFAVGEAAVFDGALIASGAFLTLGGKVPIQLDSRTARWDGSDWVSLGDVLLHALASYSGQLVGGSQLVDLAGAPFNNIAFWNAAGWEPLGGGTNDWVSDLLVVGDQLFAGGGFSEAGGVSANSIARWNGVQWRSLGSGLNDRVTALALHDNELFAGFEQPAGETAYQSGIARWDGFQWRPLGAELNGRINCVSSFGGELFVGGEFQMVGDLETRNIARWDGGGWLPVEVVSGGLRGAPAGFVRVVAPTQGLSVAGSCPIPDYNGLSVYTGDSWRLLPGRGVSVTDLATFDDGTGSGPALYIADQRTYKWTPGAPGQWSLLGSGKNDTVTSIEVFDDGLGPFGGPSLYSAGNFYVAGGIPVNRIARWDGEDWNPLGVLGGGLADGAASDMAVYDDGTGSGPALYVAGQFTFVDDNNYAYLARWDGSAWSRVGGGVNGQVTSLKVLDDGSGPALYIRGLFTRVDTQDLSAGGVTANRVARWNGAWSGLAGGITTDGDVLDLAVFDDGSGGGPRLYAAGSFTTIGGVSAKRAARWNNATNSWESLGNFGLNATARTLAAFHDGLSPGIFFGGDFTVAGGLAARYIAKWDGNTWSVVGLGTNGPVTALAPFDSPGVHALYVGGNFTSAGGVPASYFTRYEGCPLAPAPCMGDANGDRAITFADITSVLENWGAQYPEATGPGDANHDGTVTFSDATSVLEHWGAACP